MKFKGSLFFSIFSLLGVAILVGFYAPPIDNTEKEAMLMHRMIGGLNQLHYKPVEVNDDFSKRVYKDYLDRIDGGRRWLTQDQIAQLAVYELQLDDEAAAGSYEFFNKSLQLLEEGIAKTRKFYPEILAEPFDFTNVESLELDLDKKPFAKNDAELKEYWTKSLKYDVMTKLASKLRSQKEGEEEEPSMDKIKEGNDKLAGKTEAELEAEARKTVLKNYDDLFVRIDKLKRSDRLSDYLNAIASLYDPHTVYFEPKDKEDFDIRMSGTLEGIGAQLRTEDEYTKVIRIIPGGPAWKGEELEANDLIMKVRQDGEEEALDVTGMRVDDVVPHIRGKKGTKVILTVKKENGEIKEIKITRDVVIFEESYAKSVILDYPGKMENVGYIKLPQFYADFNRRGGRSSATDIGKEIEKLKGKNVNGIILDLRNNGGGSLRDVQRMTGYFIEEGPIVQVKSRDHKPEILEDNDARVQYDGPLIVMVNSFSASASEILAAALQDYGRAIIVGSKSTFGKGTVQRFFDLDRGLPSGSDITPLGEVKLTIQKFYRVNGGSTQLKGVVPDIIIPDRYHFIDVGEREHDNAMPWTEIDAVPYSQNVYKLDNLEAVKKASEARVAKSEIFSAVLDNAKRLKEQSDDTDYTLKLSEFQKDQAERKAAGDKFTELFKPIDGLKVSNLAEDMDNINMDTTKIASNEEWMKNIQKDAYLEEVLYIMRDMTVTKGSRALAPVNERKKKARGLKQN